MTPRTPSPLAKKNTAAKPAGTALSALQPVDLSTLMVSVQSHKEMVLRFYNTGVKEVICTFEEVLRTVLAEYGSVNAAKIGVVSARLQPSVKNLVHLAKMGMPLEIAVAIVAPLSLESIAADSSSVQLLGSLNPVIQLCLARRFKEAEHAQPDASPAYTALCRAAEYFAAPIN